MPTVNFRKGSSFSQYEQGTIYFETSTHLIKVGTSDSSCEIYSGVRSASWNGTSKVLTIVNEAGTNIDLNFADVASAEGVNNMLGQLRIDVNKKLDAPTTAGTQGQVLRLGDDGVTEWYTIPAATDYTVDCSVDTSVEGVLKRYTFTQSGKGTIATIDIPKDLVVTSGQIVEVSGEKYVRLTIANQDTPVDIAVKDLVDVYNATQNATEVQLAIDSSNNISASLVNGGISTEKLDSSIKTALGKANSALQASDITEGTTNGTINVKGTDVSVHGLGSAAYLNATSLVQSITEGTTNGAISVDGTAVPVHGLGSAAYTDTGAYATSAQGTKADSAIQSVSGQTAVANSDYVAISVEASTDSTTKAVTLTSHANVTTHDVSTAAAGANGLATALDVKNYIDAQHEWKQFN